jgi:hypothetical protein
LYRNILLSVSDTERGLVQKRQSLHGQQNQTSSVLRSNLLLKDPGMVTQTRLLEKYSKDCKIHNLEDEISCPGETGV